MTRRRILVGQLFHETHGFNPTCVTSDKINVSRGPPLINKARGTGTTLAGIVSRLEALDYEIVPTLGFVAQPSGPLDHGFYTKIRDEFLRLATVSEYDAIALDMHGAMGTTNLSDADGQFLSALRAVVGSKIPIGVGLDMHAHITSAMLDAVNICIACKETPHIDFPQTGERLVDCLAATLDGKLRPVMGLAKAPMIHLDSGLTSRGPLAEIKARSAAIRSMNPAIWDISLFQVYRFADYQEQKGQTALVLTNDDPDLAKRVAEELAASFWENRERFREVLPSIEEALSMVAREQGRRLFVLGDMGDRVLAGAPGDGTAILQATLRDSGQLRGVFPVTDPGAVEIAVAAGVGADVTFSIGGRLTPGFRPLEVSGSVACIGDGRFEVTGPVFGGEVCTLGTTAVLRIDDKHSILLTSEPGMTHTPAAFLSQGVSLDQHDFVVVKSGMHFEANFSGIATPITVATPGLTFPMKGFFTWKNPDFWPERDITQPNLRAAVFPRSYRPEGCAYKNRHSSAPQAKPRK